MSESQEIKPGQVWKKKGSALTWRIVAGPAVDTDDDWLVESVNSAMPGDELRREYDLLLD